MLQIIMFILLYTWIIQYGFVTIDPYSNTSGHNNANGYILLALFPFLLGLLIYFLFAHKKGVFSIKSCFKSIAISAVWLILSLVLWSFELVKMWNSVSQPIPYLFEYRCNNGINLKPTDLLTYLLYATNTIVIGTIIYLIKKRN